MTAPSTPVVSSPRSAGCLFRLVWFAAGPMFLFINLAMTATHHSPFPSWLDGLVLLILAATIGCRYGDVAWYHGQTADSQAPATMRDVKRYSAILVGSVVLARLLIVLFG